MKSSRILAAAAAITFGVGGATGASAQTRDDDAPTRDDSAQTRDDTDTTRPSPALRESARADEGDEANEGDSQRRAETATPSRTTSFASLSGSDRRAVQRRLEQEGHYQGEIDGRMGPLTQAAIRAYQRAEELEPTGRLDRGTLRALGVATEVQPVRGTREGEDEGEDEGGAAIPGGQSATRGDQPANRGGQSATRGGQSASITTGEPEVRRAQEALAQAGFHEGAVDGRLGPVTRQSLRAFQGSRELPVTGELNAQTLNALGLGAEPQQPAVPSTGRGSTATTPSSPQEPQEPTTGGQPRANTPAP